MEEFREGGEGLRTRVLIADDDPDVRDAYKDALTELMDYEVVTVDNGSDAIDFYTREPFDVVMLDIMMPGIDGIKACQTIKGVNPEAVVIAFTGVGFTHNEKVQQILRAGAYKCLPKPLLPTDLVDIIEMALSQQLRKKSEK